MKVEDLPRHTAFTFPTPTSSNPHLQITADEMSNYLANLQDQMQYLAEDIAGFRVTLGDYDKNYKDMQSTASQQDTEDLATRYRKRVTTAWTRVAYRNSQGDGGDVRFYWGGGWCREEYGACGEDGA